MIVLSGFDGVCAGKLGLLRANIFVEKYYRSEIDKYASQVAMHHFPDDEQLGDITKWREWDIDWGSIDLFIGGSPCQGFSFAGKQAGTKAVLDGREVLVTDRETYIDLKSKGAEFLSQSHLFWEYVLILDHIKKHNPKVRFLLENVKMKKELLKMISNALGVNDVVINSSLVSAQNRHRHYWANWKITQPKDKGILLKDILETTVPPDFNISKEAVDYMGRLRSGKPYWEYHKNELEGKSACLTANMYKGVPYGVLQLRPCERVKEGSIGHVARATDINGMESIKRIYGQDGKSPALLTTSGGNREPKVLVDELTIGEIYDTSNIPRIKGITEDERGFRPHRGGVDKGGITECGRILKSTASKTDTITATNPPKLALFVGDKPLYPVATAENKINEAKFIEHSGMNETAMKNGKSCCLTANCSGAWAKHSATKKVRTMEAVGFTQDTDVLTSHNQIKYRKLTPTECARLQTFPDGWCESVVSKTQAYKAYGNSWTVDVIAHIFRCLKEELEENGEEI